jgi:hypothetical protein
MKTMLKISTLIFLFCLTSQFVVAQDIIYKKGGKKIHAKIKEIGLDEVKYLRYDDLDGVLYSISKDAIDKIKFEDGRVERFISDYDNPELYADQKKRALKFNFLSPLFGFSEFTYEQNLAPGRSFETKLGIIGLGRDIRENEGRGVYVGASYKFYNKPSHFLRGMRYAHILKGGYLRPEIAFGSYSEINPDKRNPSDADRRNVTFGTVLLNLGKQWVYSDVFLLDIYGGLGFGFDNVKDEGTYNYSNAMANGFAFTAGLRIGFLIK